MEARNQCNGNSALSPLERTAKALDGDGLLLSAVLPDNHPANQIPVSNTWSASRTTLELRDPDEKIEASFSLDHSSNEVDADGPLLFALLLNNVNNNPANVPGNTPLPDSWCASRTFLEVRDTEEEALPSAKNTLTEAERDNSNAAAQQQAATPQSVPLELRDVDNRTEGSLSLSLDHGSTVVDGDGPLLLALLLNNNNNNPANVQGPIPDSWYASRTVLEARSVEEEDLPSANKKLELQTPPERLPLTLRLRGAPNFKLGTDQLAFWSRNGYLVMPHMLATSQVLDLIYEYEVLSQRLLNRGEGVLEHVPTAHDPLYPSPCGRLLASLEYSDHSASKGPKSKPAIRRLGCGVHQSRLLPTFRNAIVNKRNAEIASALGLTDPRVAQSLVIVKSAGKGVAVIPHQDGCSSFTDPPSCVTFWFALQDATSLNGCLAVAPGSHRSEPITEKCIKLDNGQPQFVQLEKPLYADLSGSADPSLPRRNLDGNLVFSDIPVSAGSLILMHGNLLHKSAANRSSNGRLAFNFTVVEGSHSWPKDSYLQPTDHKIGFERLPL